VLTVVEDEQQLARFNEVDHGVERFLRGQRAYVEGGSDRVWHEALVRERGKLDDGRAGRKRRLGSAGQFECEPRLARTERAGERQHSRALQQGFEVR
jgi:hypothetical protein